MSESTLDDSDYDDQLTSKHALLAGKVTQLTTDLINTEQYCRKIESELEESHQKLQAQQDIIRQRTTQNKQLNLQLAQNETIIKEMENQVTDLETRLETIKARQKTQNNSAEQGSIFVPFNLQEKPSEMNNLVEEIKVKKADQAIYNTFIQEAVLPRLEGITSTTQENQLSLQELLTMGMEAGKQISRLISLTECKEIISDSSGLPWSSEVRMTGLDVDIPGDFGYSTPELSENERSETYNMNMGRTSTQQDVSPGGSISMGSTRQRDSDIIASFAIYEHDVPVDMNNLAIRPIQTTISSVSQTDDNESHQSWRCFRNRFCDMNLSILGITLIVGFCLCFSFIWETNTLKYEYIECRVVKI